MGTINSKLSQLSVFLFGKQLDQTFLLTWDEKIDIKELSELLQNRQGNNSKDIDLLVLSACDTAIGSNYNGD